MEIIRHYRDCPLSAHHSVVALGNFDGVHRGHQAVIRQAQLIAKDSGIKSAVMTFEPHPLTLLRPEQPIYRITPFRQKARLIRNMGVDILFALHFNNALSNLSGDDFIEQVLVNALNIRHVVIGYDFIFGHKRSGNADLLREAAAKYNFGFTQVAAVKEKEHTFSSTIIRRLLAEGDVQNAGAMLGHPYIIEGRVRHGDKRGRTIGVPTANVKLPLPSLVQSGVYAVNVNIDGANQAYGGVANIGTKPTFGNNAYGLEAHLFDFDQDIYGKKISAQLLDFIRPEQKFSGIDALKAQIAVDIAAAKLIVKRGS